MGNLSNCDCCSNYEYDEEDECYICMVNLDEDEMAKFMMNTFRECPYYQSDDEYKIVRHQM
ncbi:MAG: DUF6472 family protein [Lachnospiraceae bacterium]